MVAFLSYLGSVYNSLRSFFNLLTILIESISSIDCVFVLVNETYDIKDKEDAVKLGRIKGDVSINNVGFAYEEEDGNVLNGVNLQVRNGETVAFVGMSGGGKSTLISLIPRFYDVTSGNIKVDGYDIRDVEQRSLRDNIGMVLQDNILFSESIATNIRMGNPEATDEEVKQAAIAANAHEFIESLPLKYDTLVGE